MRCSLNGVFPAKRLRARIFCSVRAPYRSKFSPGQTKKCSLSGGNLSELLMNLDEAQRKKVAGWIADGLKLSEIQTRLAAELGVRLTYMDVRFLVDDLKLTPKDP